MKEKKFIDPASMTLGAWLVRVVIGGVLWSVAGFFAKLGLTKYFEKKPDDK